MQPQTHLLISEVNALAKVDRNTPLIYTIVFLVHPLIEDICVQNPASMDLKHESHHQNESVPGGSYSHEVKHPNNNQLHQVIKC